MELRGGMAGRSPLDTICQNQSTLNRVMEDVPFFRISREAHGRHQMSTHWLGYAMEGSGPGLGPTRARWA